ncbi:MAG: ABC transporter ATP-binding protein [Bacteroidota bacterium]|jgi:branched-chain amino acid transport system ATP-binding protein
MTPLLATHALTAFYGDFQALFGVDFELRAGEAVGIIGANGAGKSTFLKAVTGLLPAAPETIVFDGRPIGGLPAAQIVRRGIAMVPEGRRLFPSLSVEENLLIGGYAKRTGPWNLARVYELFPALQPLRALPGNALSGGQQQMVAIGRALLANPRLLICDEISLGLSPLIVTGIYQTLPAMMREGLSVVVVEQDVGLAQRMTSRLYCFQEGRVSLHGRSSELTRAAISAAYFGSAAA